MLIGIGHKINSGKDTVARAIQYLTSTRTYGKTFFEWEDDFDPKRRTGRFYAGYSNWETKSISTKLKEIVAKLIACDVMMLEDHKFKNSILPEHWWLWRMDLDGGYGPILIPYTGPIEPKGYKGLKLIRMTPRILLNLLGTDAGRKIVHPNIWVNGLFSEYRAEGYEEDFQKHGLSPCVGSTKWANPRDHADLYPNWIVTDIRFENEVNALKSNGGILLKVERDFCFDSLEDYLVCHPDQEVSKIAISIVQDSVGNPQLFEELRKALPKESAQFDSNSHLLESETALDGYSGWDHVIKNNGTKEELFEEVKIFLNKFEII